jgi:hypothetical protein
MPYPNRGGENTKSHYVIEVSRYPALRGYPGLPEELKLPKEVDPNEKRIQQLERELLELKCVIPVLKLMFSDKSEHLVVPLEPSIIISAE